METRGDEKWFVAYVHTNTERRTSEMLTGMGVENYVPTQSVVKVLKSGRRTKGLKNVIPGMVFVRCTEQERRTRIVMVPTILRFLMDRASEARKVAAIPESEIELLKFMTGQADIPVVFEKQMFVNGTKVRVARGSLKGLEGEVVDVTHDFSDITVQLEHLGCARLSISTSDLEIA